VQLSRLLMPSGFEHLEVASPDGVIDFICGPHCTLEQIAKSTVLCDLPVVVDEVNLKMVNRLEGVATTYEATDTPRYSDGWSQPDCTMKETPAGLPPFFIHLKVGAIVLLLKHVTPWINLYPGVRLRVTRLDEGKVVCERIGAHEGERTVVLRPLIFEAENFYRSQFPIRLAYAMSLKDGQDVPFDQIGLITPHPLRTRHIREFLDGKIEAMGEKNIKVYTSHDKPEQYKDIALFSVRKLPDRNKTASVGLKRSHQEMTKGTVAPAKYTVALTKSTVAPAKYTVALTK
ncbi:hypothetical protein PFISCL1PPCAC_22049, partial [Pristionchus fissidentatus]